VLTFRDGVAALRAKWPGGKRPAYWEPSWFDQGQSATALAILQPVNANDIGAALGAGTNPIEELRGVRNFVCHRGPTSAPKIASSALKVGVQWERPSDIVNASVGGAIVFDTWITEPSRDRRRLLKQASGLVRGSTWSYGSWKEVPAGVA